MLLTLEISSDERSREASEEQFQNIRHMLVTFEVLNVAKSIEASEVQP